MGQGYPRVPSLMGKYGKPIPTGVDQGRFGDCWFLAATASLAEVPDRLLRVMAEKKTYNKKGIFRFRFYVQNQWYGINIDDRLSSVRHGHGFRPFATQRSVNGAWWMPLLEKAYAKLNQNYERLHAGYDHEAFRTLTGMPVKSFGLQGVAKEKIEPIHRYFASNNFPMTA